ncbi:MAG: type II toxin-antitoxin system VapC family toxin [Acidobacteriota bacterium]|nr:type II toxin-antitoxin system VapC family toxin [Acidobacteriota bacterium]
MALSHLLDTSVYCQPLRKKPLPTVVTRWKALGDASLCVSVLCEAEILQGLEARDSDRLWDRYRGLLEGRLPVLDVTLDVARTYARLAGPLIRTGNPRPVVDLVIAATAKTSGLILATLNSRHFEGIEGLAVEDWSH